MPDLTCEGCDAVRGGFHADEFIVGGLCPSCRDEGRARDIKAERDRYREALTRIYQSGAGLHVEIARDALNRA